MRTVSIGSDHDDAATVVLTRAELRILVGGMSELLFELARARLAEP